jgi:hypothetical protein
MSKRTSITHRQAAELPERVLNRLDLRQVARTDPRPSRRRQDAGCRGGRNGLRAQLRQEAY